MTAEDAGQLDEMAKRLDRVLSSGVAVDAGPMACFATAH